MVRSRLGLAVVACLVFVPATVASADALVSVPPPVSLTAKNGTAGDHFGAAIAMGSDTIAVGASQADTGKTGQVSIFERSRTTSGGWDEVRLLVPPDGRPNDAFSRDIGLDGDTLAIGARYADIGGNQNQGRVYVFERNLGGPEKWGFVKSLYDPDGGIRDEFGIGINLDDDTLVIGAYSAEVAGKPEQGRAYVFERDSGGPDNWRMTKILVPSDGRAGDFFGRTTAIEDDTIVIGSWRGNVGSEAMQGKAYVFERNRGGAENWGEAQILTASDGDAHDFFGRIVSLHGDTLLLAAMGRASGRGAAYVFERRGGARAPWEETAILTASDGNVDDGYGMSLCVRGDTAVVGAYKAPVDGTIGRGKAYVFQRRGAGSRAWREMHILAAPHGGYEDFFGWDVATTDDTVAVSANFADVGSRTDQGKAYVFDLPLLDPSAVFLPLTMQLSEAR